MFKLNISDKGKAWRIQTENELFLGKKVGDKLPGKEVSADLDDYELEITGATDIAGFPHNKSIEGPDLRRRLMIKGWGMRDTRGGARLRKTYRGNQLSEKTTQINFKVLKHGHKALAQIFPDQNKPAEAKAEAPAA